MFHSIKSILCDKGLTEYRIVKHTLSKKVFETPLTSNSSSKELTFYIIFFKVDSHVYRVDFTGAELDVLKETIECLIISRQWYCEEINLSEFQTDSVIMEPSITSDFDWKGLLNALSDCCINIGTMQYSDTIDVVECLTNTGYEKCSKREQKISCMVEVAQDFPYREIIINNPREINVVKNEIVAQFDLLKKIISNAIAYNPECNLNRILLSKDITKTIISLFCNALHGEQIIFGSSFISKDDFNRTIFTRPLSFFKKNRYNIDAEGTRCVQKYYVKDGVLVSAFNDMKSASYLQQRAGDTFVKREELCTAISFNNIYILPLRCHGADDIPLFDTIAGSQFFFNQITGELKMNLLSSITGAQIHIDEHIVSFINRIEYAYAFDDVDADNGEYGLLVEMRNGFGA